MNIDENKQEDEIKYTDEELANALSEVEKDPVPFCEVFLHIIPFDYQKDFLRDTSKRIVICAGRRVGKSVMTAAKALWFALMRPNTTTLIISATLRQSMLMFDTILDYTERSRLISNSVTRITRTLVMFRNGSKIKALPCGKGRSIRGETAHFVIMDEASFIPEDVIAGAILPMLATTDGTAIMLSTPFDRDHIFYRAFTSPGWSRYSYPTSVNKSVSQEFLNEQRELIGEKRFRQEFLAEFVDDDRVYFPQTLLRSCVHACDMKEKCSYCELVTNHKSLADYVEKGKVSLFGGYDPGGNVDYAAFVCVEKTDIGKFKVLLTEAFLAKSKETGKDQNIYTRFTLKVADLDKKLKMRKLLVDQTGVGQPIVEHCKDLRLPAEGLTLTQTTKEELLSKLRILFEQEKIILPSGDRDMLQDILSSLNCIEYDRNQSGGYNFHHPRGTHDDIAFALALAIRAATQNSGTVIMTTDRTSKGSGFGSGMEE